jgi:transaldolase
MISEGVCINVTLIFSPSAYEDVVDAYMSGLEDRLAKGQSIKDIASVASFFISRIDTAVDKELEKVGNKDLQGKSAIANAKLVYQTAKKLLAANVLKSLKKQVLKSRGYFGQVQALKILPTRIFYMLRS